MILYSTVSSTLGRSIRFALPSLTVHFAANSSSLGSIHPHGLHKCSIYIPALMIRDKKRNPYFDTVYVTSFGTLSNRFAVIVLSVYVKSSAWFLLKKASFFPSHAIKLRHRDIMIHPYIFVPLCVVRPAKVQLSTLPLSYCANKDIMHMTLTKHNLLGGAFLTMLDKGPFEYFV